MGYGTLLKLSLEAVLKCLGTIRIPVKTSLKYSWKHPETYRNHFRTPETPKRLQLLSILDTIESPLELSNIPLKISKTSQNPHETSWNALNRMEIALNSLGSTRKSRPNFPVTSHFPVQLTWKHWNL